MSPRLRPLHVQPQAVPFVVGLLLLPAALCGAARHDPARQASGSQSVARRRLQTLGMVQKFETQLHALIQDELALLRPRWGSGCATNSRFEVDSYAVHGPIQWDALSPSTQADFTLDGKIQMGHMYMKAIEITDPPVWSNEEIEKHKRLADERDPDVGVRLSKYGPHTNAFFFRALDEYPVAGKTVLVVGSRTPWVEGICLSYGASTVTTVDFNPPIVEDDSVVKVLTLADLDKSTERFDAVISYSSLEHDGLGRYGDPLNPWGDIQRVQKLRGLVKPNGLFFLGVPMGNDTLVYNAHRIYGPIRLSMLIQGWDLLATFSHKPLDEVFSMPFMAHIQPIHVLTPKGGEEPISQMK